MAASPAGVASLLIRCTGPGLIGDIVLGILGAVVGGWLFQVLGLSIGGGIVGAFLPPLAGALLLLLSVKVL